MSREEEAERYVKKELWGYPALVKRFFDEVQPVLVEAREEKKVQRKKEEQEGREISFIDTDPPTQTSDGKDQDKNHAEASTQCLDKISGECRSLET